MRGHPGLTQRLSNLPYTDAGGPDKKEEEDGTHAGTDVGVAIISVLVQPLGGNASRC